MKKTIVISALCAVTLAGCCCDKEAREPSLKEALKGKFHIGTALNVDYIFERDSMADALIKNQFDAIVAENCMKSMYLQPAEGEFFWDEADKLVEFGEKNGMWITGHCLVWHSQAPFWFFVDEKGKDVSREVLIERMKNHIYTVVGRYKGRIKGWDVVNEAILEDGSWRKSKFYEIIGDDFIHLAFKFAHEADPDAELYYNDYNEWHPGKMAEVVELVRSLKDAGLRIDAVGMQGHFGMDYPSLEEYRAAIDAYSAAGVKVMVTELDMSALPRPQRGMGGANIADTVGFHAKMNPYTAALPDSVSVAWNERMGEFFGLFLEKSDVVSRVTFWGVTDETSWKNDFPMRGRTDYALPFGRDYKAKQVVYDIAEMTKSE